MIKIQLIGLATIIRRELERLINSSLQTFIPLVVTNSLYFLIFGHFIGQKIGLSNGINYMEFIVPGIIMMSIINNPYLHVSYSLFTCKSNKSIEEMVVSTLNPSTILCGLLSGGIFYGFIIAILTGVVATFFSTIHIKYPIFLVFITLIIVVLFSLLGFLNALIARKNEDVSIISNFILTPLVYLSGVFYPINFLSPFWQKISAINPIFYMSDLFRYAFLGSIGDSYAQTNLTYSIVGLLILISLIFYICLKLLQNKRMLIL